MTSALTSGSVQVDRQTHPQGVSYRVTVARPERLNVVDSATLGRLHDALTLIADDTQARMVILRGAGTKAWIAGADIREIAALVPESATRFIQRLHRVCVAIRELPLPVIARIDGYCLGAGLELAVSCDLRVASDTSQFGMPEVQVGIPSVIEAALLSRLIGAGRARELVLTGRLVGANEALAWGLVGAVAPRAKLDALVDERMECILNAAPGAIRAQKALCREWDELSLTDAIERSMQAFARAYESDEPRNFMEHFLAKRRVRTDA
jgi:enoyl-CoA hydratase